jgi:hypothetical protein
VNDDERTISDWLEGAHPSDAQPMAGFSRKGPQHAAARDGVRAWTRSRFGLPDEAAVLVAEVGCALPGCPPLETVVVFWTDAATRHRFKIFKPVEQVVEDDLPYAWLKDALIDDGSGWECC